MTLNLSTEVERFIQQQVAAGFFASAEELIEEAIRLLEESRRTLSGDHHLQPSGPGTLLDAESSSPPCHLPLRGERLELAPVAIFDSSALPPIALPQPYETTD